MSQARILASISGFQSVPPGMSRSIHTSYLRPFTPGRRNSMTKLSQRIFPPAARAGPAHRDARS